MEKQKCPEVRFGGFESEWEETTLGNHTIFRRGSFPQPYGNKEWYGGENSMPFVQVVDVSKDLALVKDTKQKISLKAQSYSVFVPKGRVIVTLQGTIGRVAITQYDCFADRTILIFESFTQNTDSLFWAYTIQNKFDLEKKKAPGGTIKTITKYALSSFNVLIPSTEEQSQIGHFFQNLDQFIALQEKKLSQMQNLKKAMLEKMFPKAGSKQPEIRLKGFSGDWEIHKFSEIATMYARIGWQNLRTSEFLDKGDYMLITGTDFNDGRINYKSCYYVEKERYEQDKYIQVRNGNILITKDGTLGKVAYVEGLSMPATLNAGVFNVQVKDSRYVDERYLFQYLKAPFLMDYVAQKATGGTIKHLNQNILVDFPIIMPTKEEQTMIGKIISNLDNVMNLNKNQLQTLKNLKQALLEKIFV